MLAINYFFGNRFGFLCLMYVSIVEAEEGLATALSACEGSKGD